MCEESDSALVLQYRSGGRHAFDILMARHSKRIFAAAFRILNNREDAFDVTQTTFLRAYRHLDQFHADQSFGPWLYRIAVNEALDRIRARHPAQMLGDALADEHAGPLELAIRDEDGEALQEALAQLPGAYRTVLVLKHLQGCSYEEIAKVLECSVKTVKSRLHTARQALRAVLLSRKQP